jgi:hypothetical protein
MRAGKNLLTNELEIYLDEDEAQQMREMIRGAALPHRRTFQHILDQL